MGESKRTGLGTWFTPVPWRGFDRLMLLSAAVLGVVNLIVMVAVLIGG